VSAALLPGRRASRDGEDPSIRSSFATRATSGYKRTAGVAGVLFAAVT